MILDFHVIGLEFGTNKMWWHEIEMGEKTKPPKDQVTKKLRK
jgi:hypothetical protein